MITVAVIGGAAVGFVVTRETFASWRPTPCQTMQCTGAELAANERNKLAAYVLGALVGGAVGFAAMRYL